MSTMTAKPFRVVTPFPSPDKTAKRLGVSRDDVRRIDKLVAAVVQRAKKGSAGTGRTGKRATG